jgi:hypothetical protein
VGGGVASRSWKPARAHGALQLARLRRNARNRRFSRARPLRRFWLWGTRLASEPTRQTWQAAPHERKAAVSHPHKHTLKLMNTCYTYTSPKSSH